MDEHELTLRRTVIGGAALNNDYCVWAQHRSHPRSHGARRVQSRLDVGGRRAAADPDMGEWICAVAR